MPTVEPQTVKMIRVSDSDKNTISFDVEETYQLITDLVRELSRAEASSDEEIAYKVLENLNIDLGDMLDELKEAE